MRYRKLSDSGDYQFGQSASNFFIDDPEAVAQAVQTRLQMFLGTFWRNTEAGLPWFQRILGASGKLENIIYIDNIIQQTIKNTQGVTNLLSYDSNWDSATRQYSFQGRIQTLYSETNITGVL